MMIRRCDDRDAEMIWMIINDGAQAYKGFIPADQWAEPYGLVITLISAAVLRRKRREQVEQGDQPERSAVAAS